MNILTLSFRGDYDLCRLLCASIDCFVPPEVTHIIGVPRSDVRLFTDLANARRRIIVQEDLLPSWLLKLPLPSPVWRKRLGLPRRNVYVSLKGRPVRGWIAQQIMKLAAAAQCDSDCVMHIDSDAVFIRPLERDALEQRGRTRLLRIPEAGRTPMHAPWHQAASRLLGLPPSDYHGADYIDHCVTWRQPIVRMLLRRIEQVSGKDWRLTLTQAQDFSEYILYGVYCDKVLGLRQAGLFSTADSLSYTLWTDDAINDAGAADLAATILPRHQTIGIQSTIPLSLASRARINAAAVACAAGQDAEAASAQDKRRAGL